VSRKDQDAFALRTQQRWAKAHAAGFFRGRIDSGPDSTKVRRSEDSLIPMSIRDPIRLLRPCRN